MNAFSMNDVTCGGSTVEEKNIQIVNMEVGKEGGMNGYEGQNGGDKKRQAIFTPQCQFLFFLLVGRGGGGSL